MVVIVVEMLIIIVAVILEPPFWVIWRASRVVLVVEVRAVEVGAVEVGAVAEVMVVPHFSPLAVTGEETIDNFKLQRSVSGVHLYNIV